MGHLQSHGAAPAARQQVYEGNSLRGEYPHLWEQDGYPAGTNMQQNLGTSGMVGQWAHLTEQQYWPPAGMESHLRAGQSEMNDRGSYPVTQAHLQPSGEHVLAVAPQPLIGNEALLGLARRKVSIFWVPFQGNDLI